MSRSCRPGLLLIPLLLMSGTASSEPLEFTSGEKLIELCDSPPYDWVELRYLGVSGILVSHGDAAVMTPPFYSIPRLPAVGNFD
jgi:hypothetical protein